MSYIWIFQTGHCLISFSKEKAKTWALSIAKLTFGVDMISQQKSACRHGPRKLLFNILQNDFKWCNVLLLIKYFATNCDCRHGTGKLQNLFENPPLEASPGQEDQLKVIGCTCTTSTSSLWWPDLYFAWCTPILSWPRIMFTKSVFVMIFKCRDKFLKKRVFWAIWLTSVLSHK